MVPVDGEMRKCPICFMKETDVWLQTDRASGDFYCVKCSYRGNKEQTFALYANLRSKFRLRTTRLTLPQQEAL